MNARRSAVGPLNDATSDRNTRIPQTDSSAPAAPATNATTAPSTSSWRTMRQRAAPSARRTANSPSRSTPRDSIRCVALTHAISKTTSAGPSSPIRPLRVRSRWSSSSGMGLMVQPIAAAGPRSCRATADSSAAAWDHFFPVRSRPIPMTRRSGDPFVESGIHYRRIPLPEYVRAEAARATFKNGVLEVEIPTIPIPEGKRRTVEIQG